MQEPKKRTTQAGRDVYNYVEFNSVKDLHHFADGKILDLSPANYKAWRKVNNDAAHNIAIDRGWFGYPPPGSVDELNEYSQFSGMHLLRDLRPKIKKDLYPFLQYLDEEVLPKPKMSYNDRGLGVFSFDRAAMSLQRREKVNLSSPIDKTTSQLTPYTPNTGA